jgi:hypothetical protein
MKRCFLLTCKYNKNSVCLASSDIARGTEKDLKNVCPIILEEGKVCTRCNEILKAGKNVPKMWHIPICCKCRKKIISGKSCENFRLTEEETEIMKKRLEKYPIN